MRRRGRSRGVFLHKKKQKKADIAYVLLITMVFGAIFAALVFMPRSDESALEQRKLATLPESGYPFPSQVQVQSESLSLFRYFPQ